MAEPTHDPRKGVFTNLGEGSVLSGLFFSFFFLIWSKINTDIYYKSSAYMIVKS